MTHDKVESASAITGPAGPVPRSSTPLRIALVVLPLAGEGAHKDAQVLDGEGVQWRDRRGGDLTEPALDGFLASDCVQDEIGRLEPIVLPESGKGGVLNGHVEMVANGTRADDGPSEVDGLAGDDERASAGVEQRLPQIGIRPGVVAGRGG